MKKYTYLKIFAIAAAFFLLASGASGQIVQEHSVFLPEDHLHCSIYKSFMTDQVPGSTPDQKVPEDNYDVKFYKLDLEATDTSNQFHGSALVSAEVVSNPLEIFSIELHNKLVVDSVFIDGQKYNFDHSGHAISISPDPPIDPGTVFHFKLFYHTPPDYISNYYSSTQNPVYGDFPVSQSFSEPYSAHEWMPCKQDLGDKADSVHIFITTDSSLMAAGPGILTRVTLPGGKVRHEWRCHIPAAYYLIAFAVSDYQEYSIYAKPDSLINDSILIQSLLFDYPGCLESNKASLDKTAAMIELLSELYTLYPFYQEKYGHYMWYPSGFSGMEHITMSGMRYLNTFLISHELGHSWFGNNVTCATWSDVWINEGFATYTEYLVLEYLYSQASADAKMNTYMNYVMTQPGGSVYVPPGDLNSAGRIFSTRLSYRKGAALVHMIRYLLEDDSLFFKSLQEFQVQYRDSIATGLDFKNVCESVSGLDLTNFFNEWYFGEGYPIYNVVWSQCADTLRLHVNQTTSTTITPFFNIPMEYTLVWPEGDSTFRFDQTSGDTTYTIILSHEITEVILDQNNRVLNDTDTIIHEKNLDVRIFLEGPFNKVSGKMDTKLTPWILSHDQPFDELPWNYTGDESFSFAPPDAVDWILLELHDTTDAALISQESKVDTQAGLLLDNGMITQEDGITPVRFEHSVQHGLYLVLRHRNHLDVVSASPLPLSKGVYSYDFTAEESAVFSGGIGFKELAPGVWGMVSGDGDADGVVGIEDKSTAWNTNSGLPGYLQGDYNLDGEINNIDKDDFWEPNLGMTANPD